MLRAHVRLFPKILAAVAVAGALLVTVTVWTLGPESGVGAAAGVALALLNLLAIRYVLRGFFQGGGRGPLSALFIVAKMAVLFGVCWFLIRVVGLEPVGFLIGLSALVVGSLAGAVLNETASPLPEETRP